MPNRVIYSPADSNHGGTVPGRRPSHHGRWWSTACVLLALLSPGLLRAPAATPVDEAKAATVKAAYLRYLAEFTSWPEDRFAGHDSPIVLGIVGRDRFGVGRSLDAAIKGKQVAPVQGRPLALKALPGIPSTGDDQWDAFLEGLGACHLLFIARSEEKAWAGLAPHIRKTAVVTVSDVAQFAEQDGMIEFAVAPDTGRVVMRIALDAVQRAGLRLSSRLLGLKQGVEIVPPAGDDAPPREVGEQWKRR